VDPTPTPERLLAELAAYRELVESLNSIVLRWDPQGRIIFLNEYGQQFFGYPLTEVIGRSVVGLIVPETETSGRDLRLMIEDLLQNPERYVSNENENVRRNGDRVWITWRNQVVLGADGDLREILSTGIDTSERKRAEEALRESERRYRVLFQSTPVPLLERDASPLREHLVRLRADGLVDLRAHLTREPADLGRWLAMIRTTDCNAALVELFEAAGDAPLETVRAAVETGGLTNLGIEVVEAVAEHRLVSREREATIETLRRNRRDVIVRATIVPGHEETLSRIIVAMIDVTERKRAEEDLRHLADHDDLTGLHNKRYLYRTLEELLRSRRPVSLLFFDLDHFKQVVDSHGHLLGSRVIQEVAGTIRAAIAPPAFAVAYAGDEFVVVLPGADKAAALAVAEDIRDRIAATTYLAGEEREVRLTASSGVAAAPDDADDLTGLLALADRALFGAKHRGRNAIGLAGAPATAVTPARRRRSAARPRR
jgi:diguanylate cyclase (GGDEF)-like protein/PAS domain S-box-containing protein